MIYWPGFSCAWMGIYIIPLYCQLVCWRGGQAASDLWSQSLKTQQRSDIGWMNELTMAEQPIGTVRDCLFCPSACVSVTSVIVLGLAMAMIINGLFVCFQVVRYCFFSQFQLGVGQSRWSERASKQNRQTAVKVPLSDGRIAQGGQWPHDDE